MTTLADRIEATVSVCDVCGDERVPANLTELAPGLRACPECVLRLNGDGDGL